jgi:murein L,D-transpeptidase YafK
MLGLAILLLSLLGAVASPVEPCGRFEAATVWVDTRAHRLYACESRASNRWYDIRLGRRGTGKMKAGDGKTPLGTYPLGQPRTSKRYGTFVPVGYPTLEQSRHGFTGSAIGVHGPLRSVRWLGRAVNWFDTSDGCIGLATDEDMATLAAWVRARRAGTIVIE